MVAVPVLVQVVTAAGGRCECTQTGCHGGAKAPRCEHELPGWGLVAAPRDPGVPEHAAWRMATPGLAAWCAPCLTRTRTRTTRARAAAAAARADDLLDLLDPQSASSAQHASTDPRVPSIDGCDQ